jgi:hypothetical protein
VFGDCWLGLEVGTSGIRGLSVNGNDFQSLDTKLDNTGFASLTISFRLASPQVIHKFDNLQ